MRSLPLDFIAAINADDAPVSMLVLKLESGDVNFSDSLYGEGLPYIENISEEQDGGSFENYLSRGNLETCKLSVTLIYSDLSKATIHNVVSELQSMSADNLRCRAELWKKFVGIDGNDTCAPLLWNVYAVQDNSENFACREDQMLFPLELITLPGSENQKLSITEDPEKSYNYVIGKAEGLPLQLMEEESSKWTELIGNSAGKEVTAEYTGLIRVKDATKLRSGEHLINGERVNLDSASAGYMTLSGRGLGGTEQQEHSSGSRIFPIAAIFKYAVCAGPVGSLELLRTSNEIDTYDEDSDGNTTEYKDLYSGGNEELHQELNPAQVWFNGRMPFLWKDQSLEIAEKPFFGKEYSRSDKKSVFFPENINSPDKNAKISIDFQRFSETNDGDYWYIDTPLCAPAMPTDVTSFGSSAYISSGLAISPQKFVISDPDGLDFRRISVEIAANSLDSCWTSQRFTLPDGGWWSYTNKVYYGLILRRFATYNATISIKCYITIDETDYLLTITPEARAALESLGFSCPSGLNFHIQSGLALPVVTEYIDGAFKTSDIIDFRSSSVEKSRIKFEVIVDTKGQGGYALIDLGGQSIYSGEIHKGMVTYWEYYDNAPSAWISSFFNRNLSSKGDFQKSVVNIKAETKNTNNFAVGLLYFFSVDNRNLIGDGGLYIASSGQVDFSLCDNKPAINTGDYATFWKTGNSKFDGITFYFEKVSSARYNIYNQPAIDSSFSFADSSIIIIHRDVSGATYDKDTGKIDFNPCPYLPQIADNSVNIFWYANESVNMIDYTFEETEDEGIYLIYPQPTDDFTLQSGSLLTPGAWRVLDLTDGGEIDINLETNITSWAEQEQSEIVSMMRLDYAFDEAGNPKPRTAGEAAIEFDGGMRWLIDYSSSTLDGLQVNYADTLYVDAVSTRGANWTPARAVQYLAADHTSWAGLIDADSFDDRHDEFVTAGHYLNGTISGGSGSQDAIRTVLKEGLAGLNYPLGKITMYSYISDLAATVPVKSLMSIVRPDRESFPNRGFMQSANEMRSNRMFFRWNKNLSTGKYDGNAIKSGGTVFLNDQVVTFELVKSDIIGNSVANFLWNLWKYGYIIQDCKYPAEALAIEKHDLIESFSMADNDATANFIVVSCSQTHESAKARRGLSAKIVMIKR